MLTYILQQIRTKWSMHHKQCLIVILGTLPSILLLGMSLSYCGPKQVYVPSAYQNECTQNESLKPLESELIVETTVETSVLIEAEKPVLRFTQQEAELIAKTIYGEARGCSTGEQRLVAWCICNRVDDGSWGSTIEEVVTAPKQFHGYSEDNMLMAEYLGVAIDVLTEWSQGEQADTLSPYAETTTYIYFTGSSQHNWFKE